MVEIFSPKALKMARINAGLSQVELGKKSGISFQQINRYERGKSIPRDLTVKVLADTLAVEFDSFYIEIDE